MIKEFLTVVGGVTVFCFLCACAGVGLVLLMGNPGNEP